MKKIAVFSVALLAILAACEPAPMGAPSAPVASQPSARAAPSPLPATGEAPEDPLEAAVIAQLASNMGWNASQITLISNEPVDFPDACLGVALPGVMCAKVVTPGRLLVLQAEGMDFEYHAAEDGSRIQPATVALSWERQGGLAGFCDSLVVFHSGEVYASRCAPTAETRMGALASVFSVAELAQFMAWLKRFGPLSIDASDPQAASDRMLVTLTLRGTGTQASVSQAEQTALLQFADLLYQKLFSEEATQ
jgi:hypothetical protein